MARHRTAGAGSDAGRNRLIHPNPLRAPRILLVVLELGPASASPSCGPGNGILRAETGGASSRVEREKTVLSRSQTKTSLANRPELRGFLSTRQPRRFAGTAWWRTHSQRTGLRRPNSLLTGKRTGNFAEICASSRIFGSNRLVTSIAYGKIPLESKQGI
jgi:hypothetical protein